MKLHDDLLATRPEGAKHDSDICSICVDKASQVEDPQRPIPPAVGGPDVSANTDQSQTNTEGGTTHMTEISQEAHDALVKRAVEDATAALDKALADKAAEITSLTEKNTEQAAKLTELEAEAKSLKDDNARLNGDLDKAQLELKSASDKAAELEKSMQEAEDKAAKTELANKRLEQVKNLEVFKEDYLTTERASAWAEVPEADWAARIDEWSQLRPAGDGESTTSTTTDSASAMSGTSGSLTEAGTDAAKAKSTPPARRAVLGLS